MQVLTVSGSTGSGCGLGKTMDINARHPEHSFSVSVLCSRHILFRLQSPVSLQSLKRSSVCAAFCVLFREDIKHTKQKRRHRHRHRHRHRRKTSRTKSPTTHPPPPPTMCIQVIERFSVCRCVYYRHSIDPCPARAQRGHGVQEKTVYVGYACDRHARGRGSCAGFVVGIEDIYLLGLGRMGMLVGWR